MILNRPPMNPMSNGIEQEVCREVFAHPDAAEGPLAFAEKRGPRLSDL
jgi:hypothetical protein